MQLFWFEPGRDECVLLIEQFSCWNWYRMSFRPWYRVGIWINRPESVLKFLPLYARIRAALEVNTFPRSSVPGTVNCKIHNSCSIVVCACQVTINLSTQYSDIENWECCERMYMQIKCNDGKNVHCYLVGQSVLHCLTEQKRHLKSWVAVEVETNKKLMWYSSADKGNSSSQAVLFRAFYYFM